MYDLPVSVFSFFSFVSLLGTVYQIHHFVVGLVYLVGLAHAISNQNPNIAHCAISDLPYPAEVDFMDLIIICVPVSMFRM